ncbi:MAG: hypothetical protein QXK11_07275 [Pyrobaculum sp.]|uniref:hypothetical protein n=1 Tax=Pyrobaculum sp. TaxID=2004705 RepID=UPI00317F3C55
MSLVEYERTAEVFGPSLRQRYPRVFRKVFRYAADLADLMLKAEVSRRSGDMESYRIYASKVEALLEEMASEAGIEVVSRRFSFDGVYGRLYVESEVKYTRFGACFADYCWFDACALDEEDTYGDVRFSASVTVTRDGRLVSFVLSKLPARYYIP